MKKTTTTTAVLLLILLRVLPLAAQQEIKEQLVVPLSDPGKPGSLHVGLIAGSIHVIGYNGKDVIIDAVTGTRQNKKEDNKPEMVNGMKRISNGNALDLSAEERNNRVELDVNTVMKAVDLTIQVPQRFSLNISTVNQGNIIVEGVSGEMEISNVNGFIQLNNVSGSAVANTVNGNLTATFKTVETNTPMAFSTLNGNVDVTFPGNTKASVKLKSDMGEIYSDFDITIDNTRPIVNRTSEGGMHRVNVEDWVLGKINGGGGEVRMQNMQGNIYIRKAK